MHYIERTYIFRIPIPKQMRSCLKPIQFNPIQHCRSRRGQLQQNSYTFSPLDARLKLAKSILSFNCVIVYLEMKDSTTCSHSKLIAHCVFIAVLTSSIELMILEENPHGVQRPISLEYQIKPPSHNS